jgi:NAD-dependent SIR2 family protein deacetylase
VTVPSTDTTIITSTARQNIDGLEAVAGVSNKKMVYAHGSLRWANCMRCGKKVKSEEILSAIKRGDVPTCQVLRKKRSSSTSSINANNNNSSSNSSVSSPSNNNTPDSSQGVEDGESPCPSREPSRRNATRKRARPVTTLFAVDEDADARVQSVSSTNSNHHQDSGLVCGGVLKPGVTFFGETLSDMVRRKIEADRTKADALIVIGTSLSVAPISKVIEYLPPNVPRILINRTIVHPPSTSNTALSTPDDTNSIDGVEEEIPDFRKDYVFDAYLLGYCDDVTRALARKLFINNDAGSNVQEGMVERKKRRKTSGIVERLQNQFCGGLLSNVLQKRHSNWNAEDWADVTNVPPERVLLFPGALAAKKDGRDDSSDAVTYREVAHCDGCSKRIKGVIKKCTNCFDFDLCSDCFPKLSKTHFDGTHTFNAETAAG